PGNTKARFIPGISPRPYALVLAGTGRLSRRSRGGGRGLLAKAQIVALVFVVAEHLAQDAVARQFLDRRLDLVESRAVVDDRLRAFAGVVRAEHAASPGQQGRPQRQRQPAPHRPPCPARRTMPGGGGRIKGLAPTCRRALPARWRASSHRARTRSWRCRSRR